MARLHPTDWNRLDAWRGAAALLVAIGHMVQIFLYPVQAWPAAYSGLLAQASVMMFFVISGCSIASSGHQLAGGPNPLRNYLRKRMARILPPLVFAVLLMWALSLLAPYCFPGGTQAFLPEDRLARDGYRFDWYSALGAVVFLNGIVVSAPASNGALWSLAYEVWLYLIFFLLLLGVRRGSILLIGLSACIYSAVALLDQSAGYFLFARYSLVWAAGVGVFHVLGAPAGGRAAPLHGLALPLLMVVSGFAACYFAWRFLSQDMNYDISRFNVVFGLFFAAFIILVRRVPRWFAMSMAPIAKFGYTLYLIHFPVYLFVFGMFQPLMQRQPPAAGLIGLAALALCLLAAFLAANVFERKEFFVRLMTPAKAARPISGSGG